MNKGKNHFITNWGNTVIFTVDTDFTSVPITLVGTPELGQTNAIVYFNYAEPIFIHDIFFSMPYQFGFGEIPPAVISLGYEDKNANSGNLDQFGNAGEYNLLDTNIIFPVETEIPVPDNVDTSWGIKLTGIVGWANMLNTPASLNESTQACRVGLRVRHTFNMVS